MAAPRFLSASHSVREPDPALAYSRIPPPIIQDKSDSYKPDASLPLFGVPNPPNVIVSPNGIIHVLGYSPKEGERGVPITVRIHFCPDLSEPIYVRLLVGRTPVATKVQEVTGALYGRWQLDAAAPTHEEEKPTTALLSVEALNDDNIVVDAVTFGQFSYWAPSCSPRSYDLPPQTFSSTQSSSVTGVERKSLALQSDGINGPNRKPSLRRRLHSLAQPHSTTTLDRHSSPRVTQQVRLHRRMKTQSLMRTKSGADGESGEELYAQTPILDLVTPLHTICVGWTQAEVQAGRRLVRFGKVQDGRRLIVSCEPISQEEYCEQDSVISCIYQEESDTCFVTSVDVIYLLERLTNGEFPVEEKNRIRRNLEGLRPTTVSKHKLGYEDFFQRIMEFPDPKPRNIEKDLKVFKWNSLGQALEKILSKYSIYTTPVAEPVDSAPPETPISEISDPVVHSLAYSPSESLEQPYADTSVSIKTDPLTDDSQITSEEAETQPTAFEGSSAPLPYPLYEAGTSTRGTEAEASGIWCPDYKSGVIATYDGYGTLGYDIVEQIPSSGNYADGTGYELASYDLAFSDMAEQAINNISDNYM